MNLLDIAENIQPTEIKSIKETAYCLRRGGTFGKPSRETIVRNYSKMVTERIKLGYSAFLITIMFNQIPGPEETVKTRMIDEAERVFSTLITRISKKPRTAPTDKLPFLLGAPRPSCL